MAKRSRQTIGRLSRTKGGTYERFVTNRLRAIYGDDVKRGIGQSRSGGEIADVHGVPGWWVQTKHCKALNVWDALDQAIEELGTRPVKPLVIARKDRRGDIAVLRLEDFEEMLRKLHEMKHNVTSDPVLL